MGNGMKDKVVDFPAYCWAFEQVQNSEAIGGYNTKGICETLDPSKMHYSFEKMSRGASGDGAVVVPRYDVSNGKAVKIGSVFLKESGSVVFERDDGESGEFAKVSPTLAKYFIAGAFGLAELAKTYDLDNRIVAGIRDLYEVCLKDVEACPQSPEAGALKSSIAEVEAEVAALAKAKGEVNSLRWKYKSLANKVADKKKLEGWVSSHVVAMDSELDSFSDCAEAKESLKEMIRIAKMLIGEEEAAAKQAAKKAKEDEVLGYIESWEYEYDQYEKIILGTSGFKGKKYKAALQAGLACMPMPATLEEKSCIANHRMWIAKGLVQRLEKHGKKRECTGTVETKSREVCSYGFMGGESCHRESYAVCVDGYWKPLDYDYSKKGLIAYAEGVCEWTCN